MSKTAWIVMVILAMIVAAVALAFAGWKVAEIIALLAGVSALVGPLLALLSKTETLATETAEVHDIVNSQRTRDAEYRQLLADKLRSEGIQVPKDAEGNRG